MQVNVVSAQVTVSHSTHILGVTIDKYLTFDNHVKSGSGYFSASVSASPLRRHCFCANHIGAGTLRRRYFAAQTLSVPAVSAPLIHCLI